MRQAQVVVMLKDPRAGRVKTRLGREIGMTTAAWWFRHQVAALLRRLQDPRWQLCLAIAPDPALRSRAFPAHLPRVAQGSGDLGQRMGRLLQGLGPGPVILIGGDIPGIRPAHLAAAIDQLGHHEFVFGPAEDGGFWLVGTQAARAPNALFQGVRWSTEHTLADSLATLPGARIALLETLRDVDTAADLLRMTRA